MRIIVVLTFLALSAFANTSEIKPEFMQLSARMDKVDQHFGLQRIFANHIDAASLLNSKEPEKVLLQARISQVEAFINMQSQRQIAQSRCHETQNYQ
jgi:hypothetical protein